MFSVRMTSKLAGASASFIAHESTSWWVSVTSGYDLPTSVTTARQSCDTSSTFALSTDTSWRRPLAREAERDVRDALDLGLRVGHRVHDGVVVAAEASGARPRGCP